MAEFGFYLNHHTRDQIRDGTYPDSQVRVFVCGSRYKDTLTYLSKMECFVKLSEVYQKVKSFEFFQKGSVVNDGLHVVPILPPASNTCLGNTSVMRSGQMALYFVIPASFVKDNIELFGVL